MQKPLVSIIIPTYNRAHLIGFTLDSVLAQAYENWECIIVDDGSTDNTNEIVKNYLEKDNRFQFYNRPINYKPGGNGARNYGFKLSKGTYIQWFDSDDLMHKDLLLKKVNVLNSNVDIHYCLCKMAAFKFINENFCITRETLIESRNLLIDFLKKKIAIGTPTVLWRREILNEGSNFNENLLQSQDLDFNSRMIYKFTHYHIIDEVLIYFRTDDYSISNRFYNNLNIYVDSFLEVRKNIINLNPENKELSSIVIKEVLSILRFCLTSKKFEIGLKIISFLRDNCHFSFYRIKLERIFFFYFFFKFIGKGDTKFKSLLKF